MVSVFAELMWLCLIAIMYCCCFTGPLIAISVGFMGFAALPVSIYSLSVVVPHLSSGTCNEDARASACHGGLVKGIAAASLRMLVR